MKNFSASTISTILGLAFGVLLAFGVAVSAFQSPTQAPPQGNVPAPLNTGPADQTKTGGLLNVFGLWVNQSLGVSGGATFGGIVNLQGNRITNVGSPSGAGDVATKGFVDSQTSNLQTRVLGSCPGGQGVRAIGSDGSVTCEILPAGLAPTDVVAMGVMRRSFNPTPCCGSPGFWVSNMGADLTEYDPRGVMSIYSSVGTCPGPSGCTQQYTNNWSFSCSSGFRVGSTSVLDAAANWCAATGGFPSSGCLGGACFP